MRGLVLKQAIGASTRRASRLVEGNHERGYRGYLGRNRVERAGKLSGSYRELQMPAPILIVAPSAVIALGRKPDHQRGREGRTQVQAAITA